MSGAWPGYASSHRLPEQEDVPATGRYLELAASSGSGPDRARGGFAERGQSLQPGGEEGIVACNGFSPAAPVITR